MKIRLTEAFCKEFGKAPEGFASAPGRVELLGNHTDHQGGKVLAASVGMKAYAAYAKNDTDTVTVISEGHSTSRIEIRDLMPDVAEFNSTTAIVRGVLRGFFDHNQKDERGEHPLSGLDVYIVSEVLTGSGLSSSAAFEVLLGRVINDAFFENTVSPMEIAKIGQFAENRFFGKPCGLMDQAASSIGDVVYFDFQNAKDPSAEHIGFDFKEAGYALCAVACGAGHADLTADYASIPKDMCSVAGLFGKRTLQEVPEEEVRAHEEIVIAKLGERPYLRALHYYGETRRAEEAAKALEQNDMKTFLELANESGKSSRTLLANIIPASKPEENKLDLAMRNAVEVLGGKKLDGSPGTGMRGAVRMNGGGFSGTFLAVVPLEELAQFRTEIEARLGAGSCNVLNI